MNQPMTYTPRKRSQKDSVALKKCCRIGDIQLESLPWASAGISSSSSGSTHTGHSPASLSHTSQESCSLPSR